MKRTYSERLADALCMTLAIVFALYLRYVFRDYYTPDFSAYTSVWYSEVLQAGIYAIASDVSNYTPPYMYCLYMTSVVFPDLAPVVAIKIPSIACDFLSAWFVYLIVRIKYPVGRVPLASFICVLLAPTVVVNGGIWGQADSIYTSMLLACVYFVMSGRGALAVVAFGFALAFKLQAMFLAPALAVLWLRGKVPRWSLLIVPAVYAVAMLPAWIMGRPALEMATVYLSQASTYRELTKYAPNLYVWLPQSYYTVLVVAGLLLMTGVGGLYVWRAWKSKVALSPAIILQLCVLSLVMTPFFLPKMHDRFFFSADVLAIAYGFWFPRYYFVPIFVGFASFFAYQPYLLSGREIVPLPVLSLIMLIGMIAVVAKLQQDLEPDNIGAVPKQDVAT